MHYKIEGAIKRNRTNFIIFAILWIFIAIVFVTPIAHSAFQANASGQFDLTIFMETFGSCITHPLNTLGTVLTEGAMGNYFSILIVVTIFYSVFFFRTSVCKISATANHLAPSENLG